MATLVRFVVSRLSSRNEVTAVFPQLKYNKELYGNDIMTCYAHIGQHSSCSKEWVKEQRLATPKEYADLKEELESIGYDLKVCGK